MGRAPDVRTPLAHLLGESPAIVAVREQVLRLIHRQAEGARRLAPILLLGETGTGKGLLAGILHRAGLRADGPFVDVNCAAIPETLLEAELFGYERGAFTDARHAKAGLLQTAHRGLLFLDEVGLLPESLQAKLLKVLEERSVRRLGSTRSEPIDVWIVAATSEDLHAATRARRFREDLYHRLAVLTLRLPPLRERGEDVVRLAEHFLGQACKDYGLTPRTLAPDARAALVAYAWPGNVRELANTMERVALLTDAGVVGAEALGLPGRPAAAGSAARAPDERVPSVAETRQTLLDRDAQAERQRLHEALTETRWNIARAAARLGMPRNTFRYRMEKHGLTGPAAHRPAPEVTSSARPASPAIEPGSPGGPASPASLRWELRRVTLLRARLLASAGSPPRTEVSRALDAIVDKIRSFGGQIDELSATGLVAAFGLEPLEDAQRHAASAAVAIQKVAERVRTEDPARPAVTLAIHTADLPVGSRGDRVAIDSDAKRPARALLELLAEQAPPGHLVVSGQTAAFLMRRFELAPGDPLPGGSDPTYRLIGSRDGERELTAFVGREAELRLLRERFEQARAGRGQVVSIVGEAGIGKSRLLRELRGQVGEVATWVEGQAMSFGRTIPFHPLIDLLRRAFRIDEGDREPTVVEKIERAVAELGPDLRPALPYVRHLLSVDPGDPSLRQMDAKLRRAETFDVMRGLFPRMATRRPLVVVWEDLHWADQTMVEFIAALADGIAVQPMLVILTYRPATPPPVGDRTFHTRVTLAGLSTADCVAMARGLLSVAELPEPLQALLVRTAEGNPFFLEEVLRSLQETGTVRTENARVRLAPRLAEHVVPDTVQDVIRARIQRLPDAPRQLLELASVVGREFTRRLIDRLAGAHDATEGALRELKAFELIHETSVFPELAYAFRHALIHDVAYHSLPVERRRDLHGAVARAIEELHGDRLAEQYEVLAHHFAETADWEKALEYLRKAAEKATQAFAIREALALYERALQVAGDAGPDPAVENATVAIHQARAALYFLISDFDRSRAEAERVAALARRRGDPDEEGMALAAIGWASMWARDLDGAVEAARRAIEVAEPSCATTPLTRAHLTIGFIRGVTGQLGDAEEHMAKAVATGRSAGVLADLSLSLTVTGLLRNWEADYVAASELQTDGLAIARRHDLLLPLLLSTFLYGMTLTGKGDYEAALALYREGLVLAERVGDEAIHHRLLNCLGWLHAELGDVTGAIELNRRSAEVGRRRRDPGTLPNALVNLGENHLELGDLARAGELLDEAHSVFADPGGSPWMRWRYSMRLFEDLGALWLARGDPARAAGFADETLELATRTRSRKNLVRGWRLRGEIALARRELDDAEDAFRRALAVATEIGNPPQLWKSQVALGDLHAARHRPDAAGAAYRDARAVIARVKASLRDPVLIGSLAATPTVRRLDALVGSA
jgi:DNA-binding NtrC family response regulator/tetratricopeptide (TPR) repeat protein